MRGRRRKQGQLPGIWIKNWAHLFSKHLLNPSHMADTLSEDVWHHLCPPGHKERAVDAWKSVRTEWVARVSGEVEFTFRLGGGAAFGRTECSWRRNLTFQVSKQEDPRLGGGLLSRETFL